MKSNKIVLWNKRTYYDQRERDHDTSQQLIGYGVLFEGVSDGLVITEETPFERGVSWGKDEKRKSN